MFEEVKFVSDSQLKVVGELLAPKACFLGSLLSKGGFHGFYILCRWFVLQQIVEQIAQKNGRAKVANIGRKTGMPRLLF